MYTWFHHEIYDCHSGSDRKNTESIELSLSEILTVNLVDRLRLYLSVAVTSDQYCIFGWVRGPYVQNWPRWATEFCKWPAELEKFAVEHCGP